MVLNANFFITWWKKGLKVTANMKLRDQNDKNQIYKTKITIENFKVVICILLTIIISLDKILSLILECYTWNSRKKKEKKRKKKKTTTTTTHDDQIFHACSFIGLFFVGEYFNKVSLLDNS